MHKIFIHGTLKRGFQNHHLVAQHMRFLLEAKTIEPRPLVVGGRWFSPYLINEPEIGCRVIGEVFETNDEGLALLDNLEGTEVTGGYERIEISIVTKEHAAEKLAVWSYVKARQTIEGILSGPMEKYHYDDRYIIPGKRTRAF
jgi:gamma-glutamylaminecyclotransferase